MSIPNIIMYNNKSVYGFIRSFLEGKSLNSESTANEYERDIRQFFMTMKGKKVETLTVDDLVFKNEDIESYKNHLAQSFAVSTIARKISSVKKLYGKLEANDYPVKEAWFKVDKLKGEGNSYGVLTWEQVQDMMKLVLEEVKGDVKEILLETAVITCFRQNTLLNLTWRNVEKIDGVWVLCAEDEAIGKGKKVSRKPITDEMYEKLVKVKENYGSNKLFPLEKKTVTKTMKRLREKLGLEDDITFHSLKKCGINEAYELTGGDIMAVAEQGDHASFGTTMKYYMQKKKKYSEMVGLQIGKEVDLSPLENLSKEELLELIKNSDRSTQLSLLNNM